MIWGHLRFFKKMRNSQNKGSNKRGMVEKHMPLDCCVCYILNNKQVIKVNKNDNMGKTDKKTVLGDQCTSYEGDFMKFWAQNFQWKSKVKISRQTLDAYFHRHKKEK